MEEADREEEDKEEAVVVSADQKPWNVGHVREWDIYQENVQNLNASFATKRGIQHNSAQENQWI